MKRTSKKLELNPQLIRELLTPQLKKIAGGLPSECTGKLSGCRWTDYCGTGP